MKLCISQATTMSTTFEADLNAYALAGWSDVELWLTKLEAFLAGRSPGEARALLDARGLRAVAAAAQGGLLLSTGEERTIHWDLFRRRLDLLATLEVPTLVVEVDYTRDVTGADYGRAVEALGEAARLASGAGVRLALEFQKTSRFCASLDTAIALVAQANSPALGICLDLFHYYTGPSKFEDLGYLTPANLAWVQLCDLSGIPRELAGDGDRILPGEGDFQLDPIIDQLAAISYAGHLSLEVNNPQLWAVPPDRLADAGLRAMTRTLGSRTPVGPDPSSVPEGLS